jgi:pimeloyl-ACP methyl ester carboxylesterase
MNADTKIDPDNGELDTSRAPGLLRMAMELRAPFEFAASVAAAPWLMNAPSGDGHTVIVYPGLLASDFSTRPMRRLLRALGHRVEGWGQGRNIGPQAEVLDMATERIQALAQQRGGAVSLVGWSLGGLYARELAKRVPDSVRLVVTLGSPFTGAPGATNADGVFAWANRNRSSVTIARDALRTPPPVPTTSIYSRTDGVVAWQCSVEKMDAGAKVENIEVGASHLGLGVNPFALFALADRLSQTKSGWQPFDRTGYRRFVFPDPKRKGIFGWSA